MTLECDTCGEPIEPGNGWVSWLQQVDPFRGHGLRLEHHLKGGEPRCQRWWRIDRTTGLPDAAVLMDHRLSVFTANGFERLFGLLNPDSKDGGYAMDPADWLRVAKKLIQHKD